MSVVSRIKAAVREGRYQITEHADEEAQDDGFDMLDVCNALLEGKLFSRYTRDPRGKRYKFRGPSKEGRMTCVVCRFNEEREVRVITVFEDEENED